MCFEGGGGGCTFICLYSIMGELLDMYDTI